MRRLCFLLLPLALLTAAAARPALAQQYSADKPLGATAQGPPPGFLKQAGIDQRLGSHMPLQLHFRDSKGQDAPLSAYFGSRPVALALVYYNCAMLCPQVLHGMSAALAQTGYQPGRDYDVIVASIDPADQPADAAAAEQKFIAELHEPVPAGSVHFLTADQPAITALADAVGFHYVRVPGPDGKMTQFAHSSVIMVATPDGRLSKYLSGVEYQPRDLRLALLEASSHRIGSATDLILLYCCSYSPGEGRYTVSVLRVLGLAGMVSVFGLGAMLYALTRKSKTKIAV